MAQDGEPQVPIEPEDPEYELEEHVKFRRQQEILNISMKKMLSDNLSDFKRIMDGTSFAYTTLTVRNSGVSEITEDIQNYEHLRQIDFSLNLLKQIPALFNLQYVTNLNLSRNQITSIGFLAREAVFPYMKVINLLGNRIEKLPSVSSKNLIHINLNYNVINGLEEFDGHPLLQILELRGNKIKSLKGLKKIPKLRELYVAENELTDFKGLQNIPSLVKIHARKNKISRPEFEQIDGPKYLNLRENAVAKVNDLQNIPKSFEILNLLGTPLEGEMADNVKKEVWMKYRNYKKVNKQQITTEEKEEFDKEYKERLAEQERQRLEKEAAEREAKEQQQQE